MASSQCRLGPGPEAGVAGQDGGLTAAQGRPFCSRRLVVLTMCFLGTTRLSRGRALEEKQRTPRSPRAVWRHPRHARCTPTLSTQARCLDPASTWVVRAGSRWVTVRLFCGPRTAALAPDTRTDQPGQVLVLVATTKLLFFSWGWIKNGPGEGRSQCSGAETLPQAGPSWKCVRPTLGRPAARGRPASARHSAGGRLQDCSTTPSATGPAL